MTTRWYRTSGGRMIHRASCYHVAQSKSATPWPWADQFIDGPTLLDRLEYTGEKDWRFRNWNLGCSRCKPFSAAAV